MKIQFDNVSCTIEDKQILNNISITFDDPGIYTFIGPNGVGKSTFLSLLSGLVEPNSGNITANQMTVTDNVQFQQSLVYLTNDIYTETNDTISTIIKRYQRFGKENFQEKRFKKMLLDFKVDPNTKLSSLSTGEKKIHVFIAHMAFAPTTIILDEYLDGVDVINHKLFTQYLYQFCDTNQAKVFIVSHHAHDIYMLSDSIYLIRNQQLNSIGHIEDITSKYTTVQASTDETVVNQLKSANIEVVNFEQVGKIATITYKSTPHADKFWQEKQFQYCEYTTIPIERVIEYEFID